MAVLPEDMNKIDTQDPQGSLKVIEQYIRYMGERIEFSFSQMTKNVSAAGVSSAEIYILVTAMGNQISAMQSSINGIVGRLNGIDNSIAQINNSITAIQENISTINGQITSLDARVTALEERQ